MARNDGRTRARTQDRLIESNAKMKRGWLMPNELSSEWDRIFPRQTRVDEQLASNTATLLVGVGAIPSDLMRDLDKARSYLLIGIIFASHHDLPVPKVTIRAVELTVEAGRLPS